MIARLALSAVLVGAGGGVAAATPHPAVCRVAVQERGGEAYGSGTLVDARDQYGLVVTNWHVVRDAAGKIEVRFPGGFTSEARPLKLDETWDLAALVVWRPPAEPAPLAMTPPQPGDRLTICGYGGGDYLAQSGRCTDYYSPEVGQPQELVELNVQARQGDSGGPIFNDRGELAGVLFGAAQGATLGSFGGRVQTFLATLAPDIGDRRPQATLIAANNPSRRRKPTDSRATVMIPRPLAQAEPQPNRLADPFLIAERSAPPRVRDLPVAAEPTDSLAATVSPPRVAPQVREEAAPPPSLADRSSAPHLAASRREGAEWFAPAAASEPALGFRPQASDTPPETPGGIDFTQDGRTLLMLLGGAALAVSILRMAA